MLGLIITFLIIALIAGLLGFTGVEFVSIEIARTLFFIFLILFIISLIYHLLYNNHHHGNPPL